MFTSILDYASTCVTKTVGVSVNVTLSDMKEMPLSCCVIMNMRYTNNLMLEVINHWHTCTS